MFILKVLESCLDLYINSKVYIIGDMKNMKFVKIIIEMFLVKVVFCFILVFVFVFLIWRKM